MDALYLAGSVLRDLRHKHDMKEVLVSKSFDGRDTLCTQCFCQGAQLRQIKRTLGPLDLPKPCRLESRRERSPVSMPPKDIRQQEVEGETLLWLDHRAVPSLP